MGFQQLVPEIGPFQGPAFLFSWVPGVHTGPVPAHSESESESGGSSSSGGSRLGFLFWSLGDSGPGMGPPGLAGACATPDF